MTVSDPLRGISGEWEVGPHKSLPMIHPREFLFFFLVVFILASACTKVGVLGDVVDKVD